jgi:molecular chaperone DnaK (HSP70)
MITTTKAASEITRAYDVLADRPSADVDLLKIYHLVDMTRAQFHAGLLELLEGGRAHLEQEAKLRRLTAEDHEIAIHAGGEAKHLLWIQ